MLIAFVWLDEVPLITELLGGLVVILGVLTLTLGDRLRRRTQASSKPLAANSAELSTRH